MLDQHHQQPHVFKFYPSSSSSSHSAIRLPIPDENLIDQWQKSPVASSSKLPIDHQPLDRPKTADIPLRTNSSNSIVSPTLAPRKSSHTTKRPADEFGEPFRRASQKTMSHPPPRRRRSLTPTGSGSSSGSSSPNENDAPVHSNPAKGRKVAASLQLFKDLAINGSSVDLAEPFQDHQPLPDGLLVPTDDKTSTHYEFVKRSDWPQREAARRENSSSTLSRVRTQSTSSTLSGDNGNEGRRRFSLVQPVEDDSVEWTKRGRPKERVDHTTTNHSPDTIVPTPSTLFREDPLASIAISQNSPSVVESPLITPTDAATYVLIPNAKSKLRDGQQTQSEPPSTRGPEASTPRLNLSYIKNRLMPHQSSSGWSGDEDSGWETASATTSASASSFSPFTISPDATPFSFSSAYASESLANGHDADPDDTAYDHDENHEFDPHFSKDELPHIPLEPFRNQVGGHNAIYKFTKRAVCKPLVSRENLFYESVEREAPPLLAYIPRYLGVMLVSYRRKHKEDLPFTPRPPPLQKAATAPSATQLDSESSPPAESADTESDDAEMPEVVLDRNRHIIPEWLLRADRSQSFSHGTVARRTLRHLHLTGATLSTPDLAQRLSQSLHTNGSPHATPQQSSNGEWPCAHASDEESSRPTLRSYQSDRCLNPETTLHKFGGIGSTMVNTKFKDHVFNTVLRRFRRRSTHLKTTPLRIQDEGDVADVEDYSDSSAMSARRRRNVPRTARIASKESETTSQATIRRVKSEQALSGPSISANTNGKIIFETAEDTEHHNLFDFEDENSAPTPHVPTLNNVGFVDSFTRRHDATIIEGASTPPLCQNEDQPSVLTRETNMSGEGDITRQNHFILMEDLTGRMKHSSVLDLKMGSRQYGMDATSAKKKSQRKKCDRTTSRSLGARMCGMQVWNNATQTYYSQDKYKGREIKSDDFHVYLAKFLSDGERLLAYQIPGLLQKLYGLARIINRLNGYRFYGCSLLLIYDGDKEAQEAYRQTVLENPNTNSRSRRGESLQRSRSQDRGQRRRPSLRRTHSEELLNGSIAKRSNNGKRKRGECNVRVVDFAHTTTGHDWLPLPESFDVPESELDHVTYSKGYNAKVDSDTGLIYARFPPHYPDEPDRGFLFGIKSLCEALERIWNQERLRRIKILRDDPSFPLVQLPPLPKDGCEILSEIFADDSGHIST